jgi:hypothetical protein
MNTPNLLLVGAAKSGTTSLYYYLNQHPDIFMSKVKEPRFITSQFLNLPQKGPGDKTTARNAIKTWKKYKNLFKNADEKIIGEGSVDTLYYGIRSVEIIKKYLGNPKILMVLRNPIKRAYSAYKHLVRDGRETLNFAEALKKEEDRIKSNWEFIWHYKNTGLYYQQVKAFLEGFDQVNVILFRDFKKDTKQTLKNIFKFLDVDDSFIPSQESIHNKTGIPKNKLLHNLVGKDLIINKWIYRGMKKILSDRLMEKIRLKIVGRNLENFPAMKKETKEYLINYYKEDVKNLEKLLNRDLSFWLK